MNVLVTSAGSNTAIGIIKALRLSEAFAEIVITATDINPFHLCAGAQLADSFVQVPYVYEKEKYTEALLNAIRERKIDCVFPIHDDEISLVAELKAANPGFCGWAVNSRDIVDLCNNKMRANSVAVKLGITIPKTFASYKAVGDANFPVILKPVNGVSSRGIVVAQNRQQLEDCISDNPGREYLIQSFLPIDAEYTVDTYSHYFSKKFYGGMVRQRLETKDGIATKAVTLHKPELLEMAEAYLDDLGYEGMANLQFIQYNNEYYFIEINPRFSGAGILSIQAGFNSPEFTLTELAGGKLPEFGSLALKHNYFMTRYWQESFAYAAGDNI